MTLRPRQVRTPGSDGRRQHWSLGVEDVTGDGQAVIEDSGSRTRSLANRSIRGMDEGRERLKTCWKKGGEEWGDKP